MDGEVQKNFMRILKKQGVNFVMGAAVQGTEASKTKAKVTYKLRKDDSEHTLDADVVLVSTGRKPFHDGLGLEGLGVELTKRGQIDRTLPPGFHGRLYRFGRAGPARSHVSQRFLPVLAP